MKMKVIKEAKAVRRRWRFPLMDLLAFNALMPLLARFVPCPAGVVLRLVVVGILDILFSHTTHASLSSRSSKG
jgi:hypothetical protein